MGWHTNRLRAIVGIGSCFSMYSIVALATMLYPYPRFGYWERTILLLAFILITLPFVLLFGFVMSRRRKKKEAAEAAAAGESKDGEPAPSNGQAPAPAPSGSSEGINAGFEETVQFLKSSNLGTGGRDAVYGLPWYLVAGAPRSGKSSLVISSNLNFQNLPSQRQAEQKFVRPTPSIDWRVTSEAVFIDSAGRYQSEGLDANEWSSLLEAVKKYRANRPLDGLILVVDADRILDADEREIEELAKVQRSRLDEVMQRLKVRFPVYLVFTHADAIEGFRDSFSASKAEDKALVWGATIPIEKSENAQALFDGEYAILHDSLMKRRIARLSAPFPPVRQLKIFNFPLHFGTGRRKFGAFVNALFRPSPFSENPFLRGFYFTAAPPAQGGGQQTVANGFFTERLFRDVVLRDKDLVSTFIAQKAKAPIFGWLMTILTCLVVFLLLAISVVSLVSNNQMLAQAEVVGDRMLTIVKADKGRNPLEKNEVEAKREINTTEEMRQLLVRLDDNEREGAPFYMRFGMYAGNRVFKESLLPMYFAVVEQRYKKPMVARLEAELRKFADSQPVANPAQLTETEERNLDRHYELLKAYLMLSGEDKYQSRAESSHLSTVLADFWVTESKVPPDMKLIAQQQLEFWSKQVHRDTDEVRFPRISINGQLVDATRKKLQALPPKYRYLSRKVSEISREIDESTGKTTAERMLTDKGADPSFIESNYTVPSAYTRAGLEKMQVAILEASVKLGEDDWVMGEEGRSAVATATDTADIQERYYRDYADHWRTFVKNTKVRAYKDKDEAAAALLSFSSANSPIKVLVGEIKRNTNFSGDDEGWIAWIKQKVFGKQTQKEPDTQPEKEFRALVAFMGTPEQGEKAPVEVYRTQIGNVHKSIAVLSDAKLREHAAAMAKDDDPLKLRPRETAIQALLAPFSETSSGGEVATFLQQPIDNLKALLGAGVKDQVARSWTQEILPAANDVAKGFPFEDGASEADLAKLTAFLNPNDGKFTTFYKERLATFFEEADGQLKVKEGAGVQFSDEFVAYLNSAMALQKALFGSNPTPKFEYEFTIKPTASIVEVNIDGQKVTSVGTGSSKLTFPASGSAETGVVVRQVSDSSTAPAANANTSSGPPADGPLTFSGNWGLFRFVDAGNPQKQAGGEYNLTYNVGGRSVSVTIRPSGGDPFDKSLFRSLKAPQTIVK